jgi:hypothetical protein
MATTDPNHRGSARRRKLARDIVLARSPTEFGKLIAEETEKWAKLVVFRAEAVTSPTDRPGSNSFAGRADN